MKANGVWINKKINAIVSSPNQLSKKKNGLDVGILPFRLLSFNSKEKTLRVRMFNQREIYIFKINNTNEVTFQIENLKRPSQKLFRN